MIGKFSRLLIKRILGRSCSDVVPRSGEKGKRVNCYSVYLKAGPENWLLLVEGMSEKGFFGKYWNGDRFYEPASIPFNRLENVTVEIERYIGLWTYTYTSAISCVIRDWTYINRIPIIRDSIDQFFFNRRDLVLTERTRILKALVKKHLEEPTFPITELSLPKIMHGSRWILHPDREKQQTHARLMLESLEGSGELKKDKSSSIYKLTGKAITSLETYERESNRHEQIISQSRHMKWLTFALIIVGIAQAFVAYYRK